MPISFSQVYIHIVFSSRNRRPFLDGDIETELFAYIGQILNNQGCKAVKIGGYKDHIHILCLLSRTNSISKIIREIKASSTKWLKGKSIKYQHFSWQEGYGVFSVSRKAVKIVKEYIENQEEHHKESSFKEELEQFLEEYDIKVDRKYLYD